MQGRRDDELLKQQVIDIMNEDQQSSASGRGKGPGQKNGNKNKKKKHKALKVIGLIAVVLLLCVGFMVGTKTGRRILYRAAGNFVYSNVNNEDGGADDNVEDGINHAEDARDEDYVTNYLIFGIEKIGGARNTDSMMVASINTKDDTIKLTSLLRDSYVDIPGYKTNKLNSAYSKGGVKLLIETIEMNYKIQIDGFVSVDFDAFEQVVDMLGGVDIELGKEEAEYLNKTNYISKKSNRKVKPGVNHLNGNQAMGYVRVRKVKTLGGANSDYGRIVRQQRVLKALFDSYVSPKNLFQLIPLTKDCLSYVNTNLTQKQIEKTLEAVVENKITKLETFRVPVDGAFDAPKKYNGIGYPLVLDWETNRVELYKFIYGDTEQEAKDAIANFK